MLRSLSHCLYLLCMCLCSRIFIQKGRSPCGVNVTFSNVYSFQSKNLEIKLNILQIYWGMMMMWLKMFYNEVVYYMILEINVCVLYWLVVQIHVQFYVCASVCMHRWICSWMYASMYVYMRVFVYLCLCPCKTVPGRQAGCVTRWQSKALYVCVSVCVEQVCLAAPHSLLPICAPVCVPPAPTLCQQHHTMARRPRREGCCETRGRMG